MINGIQIGTIGIVVALLTGAETRAGTPGRATLVSIGAEAGASIGIPRLGDPPCVPDESCRDREVLNAPGSITAQVTHEAGASATATVTISVTSSGGGVQRIDIFGSATARQSAFRPARADVSSARFVVRVLDGPVRVTITRNFREVQDGLVVRETIDTSTFDRSPDPSTGESSFDETAVWGAAALVSDSTSSNNSLSVEIFPLAGDVFTWVGPSGGAYSEPTNWDPELAAPPTHDGQSGDTAIFQTLLDDSFNEINPFSVSAIGATAERFIINEVSLDLVGSAQVFEPSSVIPSLTLIRGGRLTLENGARLSGVHGSVGFTPGLQGALAGLEINGGASDSSFSGRLIIGEFSDGELFLADGATLSCDQAIIGDVATGTASITGFGSRWDANSLTLGAISAAGALEVFESGRVEVVGQVVVGERSMGALRLTDAGKVVAGEVVLGKETGGDGTIELQGDFADEPSALEANGVSSFLEVNGALRVGVAGDGLLSILKGSTVRANELHFAPIDLGNAQESRLFVSGTDIDDASSSLTVFTPCALASGRLDVFNGAQANFANLDLGAGGTTDVDVAAFGDAENPASLIASRLTVGLDDFATLKVEAGGQVTCSELAVSSLDTGGTGRIVVTEGIVKVNGTMRVSGDALQGDNSVIIEGDGSIAANALRLGDQITSDSAEIVVRNGTPGGGSTLVVLNGVFDSNSECSIGKDGPGVLRLENHGLALATGLARVGGSPTGGAGIVEIGADCRFVAHDLDVGGASPGTIKLLAASSELIVTGSAVVNDGGRIEGIGTFDGARVRNPGGFISPGLSPGTLTIKGDYEQGEGGTLIIEVAGRDTGQFDVLRVTGSATLAGTLLVKFMNGFVPDEGDSLRMLEISGAVTGQFSEVRVEGLPEGQPLNVESASGLVVVGAARPAGQPPNLCGPGLCGVGMAPLFWLSLCAIWVRRPAHRRSVTANRGRQAKVG